MVSTTSGAGLIGMPFHAVYAGATAGLARFGEALRCEQKGEGIHVLAAYPGDIEAPMMRSSRAGPELGFSREPATDVAGVATGAFDMARGGEARAAMLALNGEDHAVSEDSRAGAPSHADEIIEPATRSSLTSWRPRRTTECMLSSTLTRRAASVARL